MSEPIQKGAPVVDAERIPQVAVESMNRTHREEVDLVNELGALLRHAVEGEMDTAAIDRALDRWLRHTEAHFDRENRLMEEYGFPPFPIHAQEHATVLEELRRLQSQWLADRQLEPLRAFVLERWPQWFLMHVNSMDTITAQFLANFID